MIKEADHRARAIDDDERDKNRIMDVALNLKWGQVFFLFLEQ